MTNNNFAQWLYNGHRPNWLAKIMNSISAALHATGIAPNYLVTLDVIGRKSGKTVSLPLVMVVIEGQRYLVSMLGVNAQWVLNAHADGDRVVIRSGKREQCRIEEVATELRAPIIKAYLQRAPGARPHIPVNKDAPLADFEKIAADFPVFKVVSIK